MSRSGEPERVRLVNLTWHPVEVDGVPGGVIPVPPDGQLALVDEPERGTRVVRTADGAALLRTVARSERIAGLPDPVPGVLYVVPRLTALAAADRDDVVFPLDQRRDGAGALVAAGCLGAFELAGRRRGRWWRPRRLRGFGVARFADQWSTGRLETAAAVALTSGTALGGAALGIPPDLAAEGWPPSVGRVLMLVVFAVLSIVGLVAGTSLLGARLARRRRHGSAYLVEEIGGDWTVEEKAAFVTGLAGRFAEVLRVPGPARRGARRGPGSDRVRWAWQTDARSAADWGERLDDLVHAFWTTHFNDDEETGNAVFVWAPWPVAMGFGARASAGRRWAGLKVGQRPSRGRAGSVEPVGASQPIWSFRPGEPGTALLSAAPVERRYEAALEVTADVTIAGGGDPAAVNTEVVILLIRLNASRWGPLPPATDADSARPPAGETPGGPVVVEASDGTGLLPPGRTLATLVEFRYVGSGGTIPWDEFPALTAAAADWIERQCAAAPPGAMVLLGLAGPQEIGVGLGIAAADPGRAGWPEALFPLVWVVPDGPFVVPDLRLGREAVRRSDWRWG